ncbi:MAG: YdcH family protein [Hellea sp.]
MAVSARLEQLSSKHTTLDMQIREEMRSPLPDTMRISRLKREKLQIKDTIESFEEPSKN